MCGRLRVKYYYRSLLDFVNNVRQKNRQIQRAELVVRQIVNGAILDYNVKRPYRFYNLPDIDVCGYNIAA